jgi:hypothetical protein
MRSAARASFNRKPLAPARIAAKTYSSRSKVVRMRIPRARSRLSVSLDPPGRLDPVQVRHADVHEYDVGLKGCHDVDGLGAVIGFAVTTGVATAYGWRLLIPQSAVAGSLLTAIAIAVIAGLWPAIRASRLSPTDALPTT